MTTETPTLWGGRFTQKPDETFAAFNSSFRFDRRLFESDVRASIAHANGLKRAGVLNEAETDKIIKSLNGLRERARTMSGFFDSDAEDVHSFIESKLVAEIGDLGKKLTPAAAGTIRPRPRYDFGCERRALEDRCACCRTSPWAHRRG